MSNAIDATATTSEVWTRRRGFYNETIVLEVGGLLYRVYQYGFEKWSRSIFPDMFSLPQDESLREGESDANPIKLTGCTTAEFESVLEVMYPRSGLIQTPVLSKEEWTGVLKLSRLWDMPDIAAFAIKEISSIGLTAIERIILGKMHGVPTWLKEGYISIANDLSQTSFEELSKLGSDTAFRILWVREETSKMPTQTHVAYDEPVSYPYPYRESYLQLPEKTSFCRFCNHCTDDVFEAPSPSSIAANIKLAEISKKVSQMFEEELKDAEMRNATVPASPHP